MYYTAELVLSIVFTSEVMHLLNSGVCNQLRLMISANVSCRRHEQQETFGCVRVLQSLICLQCVVDHCLSFTFWSELYCRSFFNTRFRITTFCMFKLSSVMETTFILTLNHNAIGILFLLAQVSELCTMFYKTI